MEENFFKWGNQLHEQFSKYNVGIISNMKKNGKSGKVSSDTTEISVEEDESKNTRTKWRENKIETNF